MMLQPLLRALTVLVSMAGVSSGASSSLDLTASIRDSVLEVRWENVSDSTLLLSMGGLLGSQPLHLIHFVVDGLSSKPQAIGISNEAGIIEGRVDPWVITLPTKAAFEEKFSLFSLLLPDGRSLASVKESWRLTIQFTGRRSHDNAPGGTEIPFSLSRNGPTSIPFWIGTVSVELKH